MTGLTFERKALYSSFPTYSVTLPTGGRVELAVTSADHVSFDGNYNCLSDSSHRCWMEYRGNQYGAHFHYHLKDGQWASDSYKHAKRIDTYKDASEAAVRALNSIGLEVVREFHQQHAEVFREAERLRLKTEIERTKTKLTEAEETVVTLRHELHDLKVQLQRLED